jgi:aldose 1-epimerase
MEGEHFGTAPSGEAVQRFTIKGGGLTASIISWASALQDLRLDGHDAPLVLGFERFADYPAFSPYFGAIAGRCANRIAGGRFAIAGRQYQADTNFLGKHALHGGSKGYGKRVWDVALHGDDFVTLVLHSPDGDMGFPGNLEATCTYRLKIPGTLSIELTATTDEPTLCNLTNHSYFNLDDGGSTDILDHRLMINGAAYLPVDDELIPTGVVQPVAGTAFDFRQPRPIRHESDGAQTIYDHNFCLAAARGPLRQAAWAQGARSGVEMEMWTTEPGVQFYAGHKVDRPDQEGLGGRRYKPRVPQAVLWPGEIYRHVTEYRFRQG